MSVRIACLHGQHDLRLETIPETDPGPGEVRVRVGAGGICGSDLHYWQDGGFGPIRVREPVILGHEIAGRPAPRPEIRPRSVGRAPPRGPRRLPPRQSFFESLLSLGVGLRMARAHREPPVAKSRQVLADRPLVQLHPEPPGDPGSQILPSPAHHPVHRRIGTRLQPRHEFGHLPGVEPPGARRASPVREPSNTSRPTR